MATTWKTMIGIVLARAAATTQQNVCATTTLQRPDAEREIKPRHNREGEMNVMCAGRPGGEFNLAQVSTFSVVDVR